jgi:hypothetical protein
MYILTLDIQHGRAVSSQSAFVWLVEFFVLVLVVRQGLGVLS